MKDLASQIEEIITGKRTAKYDDKVVEESYGLASAPVAEDVEYDESKDPYSHYYIHGTGPTKAIALLEFWQDYCSKKPYGGTEIFWRLKPEIDEDRAFLTKENRIIIVARFTLYDSITSR